MTTSKAFQDALNEEEPIKEVTPEVVIDQETGIILSVSGNKQIQHHEAWRCSIVAAFA